MVRENSTTCQERDPVSRLIDIHVDRGETAFQRGELTAAFLHWRIRRALEQLIPGTGAEEVADE